MLVFWGESQPPPESGDQHEGLGKPNAFGSSALFIRRDFLATTFNQLNMWKICQFLITKKLALDILNVWNVGVPDKLTPLQFQFPH